MQLTKLHIKNFRLIKNATLKVSSRLDLTAQSSSTSIKEPDVNAYTTLIVGRNNSAKTSCMEFLRRVLTVTHNPLGEEIDHPFSFDDYPLSLRSSLYSNFRKFLAQECDLDELKCSIPTPSLTFTVDYSQEGNHDDLGALADFIVNLEPEINTAKIRAEYVLGVTEHELKRAFDSEANAIQKSVSNQLKRDDPNERYPQVLMQKVLTENFPKWMQLRVRALLVRKEPQELGRQYSKLGFSGSENDADIRMSIRDSSKLRELFPFFSIAAERTLGEDDENHHSSIASIVNHHFLNATVNSSSAAKRLEELFTHIAHINAELQERSDSVLGEFIKESLSLGQLTDAPLNLATRTTLNIDEQITDHTTLLYSDEAQGEYLPNTHNGLGLKNLIKIEFQLTEFVNSLRDLPRCVPLLFIEEPESHMHPQLQKLFTRYLGTFMSHKMEGRDTQIFITSHSPHIANTMEFANIRYVKRCKDNVTFKVLSEFSASESDRRALSKYLNLIFCDVFFADKIILVEGLAEQILLPDMINKCQVTGDFNHPRRPYMRSNAPVSPTYLLPYQYYSIIPVGGSHAYKLLPLIHFLEVPCLVLTDIDAFKYDSSAPKQEQLQILPVKNCNVTTNPTLKYWINNECRMNIPYQLKETSEDSFEDKNRTFLPLGNFIDDDDFINLNVHQNMHIAYQTPEYQHNSRPGYRHRRWIEVDKERWGRSFEEAILWACSDEQAEKLDKHFREHRIDFKGSKTDFALNIIFNNLDYTVPRYIREGLQWLNDAGEY